MKPTFRVERVILSTARNLVVLLTFLIPYSASAQGPTTGTPPFGSFGGGPDVVNLGNLNVHLDAPVFSRAGRGGFNFTYSLSYDSSIWYPVGASGNQTWQPVGNWGWRGQTEVAVGYVSFDQTTVPWCLFGGQYYGQQTTYSNWVYHDSFGVAHGFVGSTYIQRGAPAHCNSTTTSMTVGTGDGSGWVLSATGGGLNSLTSISGTVMHPPVNTSSGAGTATDRNGNQITVDSSGHFYDTLSGTTPVLSVAGSGTPASPLIFTYTPPAGGSATVKVNYTQYTVNTYFHISGVPTEYPRTSVPLVSSIVLPDQSQYSFTYESTPAGASCTPLSGTTSCVTARVASVTLPTGGVISYSYSFTGCTSGSNGIFSDGSTSCLQRTTPDGTWTYARTQGALPATGTLVTAPQLPYDSAPNQSIIQFQGIYETQRDVYQGTAPTFSSVPILESTLQTSNLLRETQTCYNGSAFPCSGVGVTLLIGEVAVRTQLGSGGTQCEHDRFYNSTGTLQETDDYDYGASPHGALLRKILYAYASLGNGIVDRVSTVTVCNGTGTASACNNTGTVIAQTTYSYDGSGVTAPPNQPTPQHVGITGSRGNLTSVNYPVSGLTGHFTYYDTGNPQTATDVNAAGTTYNYGALTATCGNTFPTSITEPVGSPALSRSMTWNCTGGVRTQTTDENGKTTTAAYSDPYFWRPASATDAASAITNYSYLSPTSLESSLSINSNSVVDTLATLDGLGRNRLSQIRQAPSSSNFDTVEQDYDNLGRPSRSTVPYNGTSGQTSSSASAVTTTYDALGRPLTVTDGGGGTVSYSYLQNDVLVSVGPAPTGENTKRRQLEYDGLGRLISVCELTTATGSGTCAQGNSQTGFWTKYTYDANNNLVSVTQNAQATSGQQTRSFAYDSFGRLTSETNPENGATTYSYDSASGCTGTYNGDLVKKVDAVGNTTCFTYDALHRVLSKTYPSGSYASVTPSKHFVYDSATVNGVAMTNAKGRLAEAYTCTTCPGTNLTDIGYSYTNRGEISDVYQSTQHSGGYYHLTQNYWPHGTPNVLSGLPSLPTITYGGTIGSTVGLNGEGRITQITAGTGANPVTGVTYSPYAAPPQTTVTFGSGDSDNFQFDAQTGRTTQYKFNVGTTQSMTGALTWNTNSTLKQLAITDPFNSADTQTCAYGYDDLTRLTSTNCGTPWSGAYTFDPFGNIAKSGSMLFSASYSNSTNRMTLVGTFTPTYDNNGNVLNDGAHTYSWDADGNSITVDGVGVAYDALDRATEQNRSGSYTQIVYGPRGDKLGLMNGQSLVKAFVPLSGGATAVYTSAGLDHYRHADWLGSTRLSSTPSRTVQWSGAYGPWGELYASSPSGSSDPSFTGQNSDTSATAGEYDFLYRQYGSQGRWSKPDPAGLAVVTPSNPQSWNRYAYVLNNPVSAVDPLGYECVWDDGSFDEKGDPVTGTVSSCQEAGGTWIELGQLGNWSATANPQLGNVVDSIQNGNLGQVVAVGLDGSLYGTTYNSNGTVSTTEIGNLITAYAYSVNHPYGFDDGTREDPNGAEINHAWRLVQAFQTAIPVIVNPDDVNSLALALALNKTGVQSLNNPCTVGSWYFASTPDMPAFPAVKTALGAANYTGASTSATDYIKGNIQLTCNRFQ